MNKITQIEKKKPSNFKECDTEHRKQNPKLKGP
jgi:hypothetical protein